MNPILKPLLGSVLASALAVSLVGWSAETNPENGASGLATSERTMPGEWAEPLMESLSKASLQGGERYAYFGDLHVHTTYSMDAFQFGTLATSDDAYRYSQRAAIKHPGGIDMQLDRPLDFCAVTDQGFYLGVVRAGADTTTEISKYPSMQ